MISFLRQNRQRHASCDESKDCLEKMKSNLQLVNGILRNPHGG